ncbi:hypothetical protein ACXHQK_14430 [Vibrio chemaguriensis]
MYLTPVIVSEHLGKKTLTGTMSLKDIASQIQHGSISVNPDAQRSLGADQTQTTKYLLSTNEIGKSKRMQSFCNFMNRILRNIQNGKVDEGFLGCIQLIVDENNEGLTLKIVEPEKDEKLSHSVALLFESMGKVQQLAVMKADPGFGKEYAQIGDGQGRSVGFYHWYNSFLNQKAALQKLIQKKEKKAEDTGNEQLLLNQLLSLEPLLNEVFDHTRVSFMIYAKNVDENGNVQGLGIDAQRRLYIEGNALNSQASTEQIMKYENYSPIILDLIDIRSEIEWMAPKFIEEDAKSIGKSSVKVFTLSAVAKAHCWAICNHDKPIEKVSDEMIVDVEDRATFVRNFWKKIDSIFGEIWIEHDDDKKDRTAYLKDMRDNKRCVLFQNIFLQALGQTCYRLGRHAGWDKEYDFAILDKLSPSKVNYNAFDEDCDQWNSIWTDALMKPNQSGGFAFNNVTDSITKTRNKLVELLELAQSEQSAEEQASFEFE